MDHRPNGTPLDLGGQADNPNHDPVKTDAAIRAFSAACLKVLRCNGGLKSIRTSLAAAASTDQWGPRRRPVHSGRPPGQLAPLRQGRRDSGGARGGPQRPAGCGEAASGGRPQTPCSGPESPASSGSSGAKRGGDGPASSGRRVLPSPSALHLYGAHHEKAAGSPRPLRDGTARRLQARSRMGEADPRRPLGRGPQDQRPQNGWRRQRDIKVNNAQAIESRRLERRERSTAARVEKILAAAGQSMKTRELADPLAEDGGDPKPIELVRSSLAREVKRGERSRIVKLDKGVYGLRGWGERPTSARENTFPWPNSDT